MSSDSVSPIGSGLRCFFVPKLMLSMGLPMIISMIVQASYNIVDSYFVSRITDDTIENIGEYAVGVGTGVGINALLSRSLGEKDLERAGKIAGKTVWAAIPLGELVGTITALVIMGKISREIDLKD